ncbi:hypothetical protein CRD59_06640 [Bifidobacterium xylocopae]|uniref:Uncharacterized protein n=1 Tax=Bifidobacterium xylocopae TaxID=2493119 RepID=A0A366KBD5_9BIFI|nr:hypothetical protein CRD59_06640 [Bifidobacterium xylocopae]
MDMVVAGARVTAQPVPDGHPPAFSLGSLGIVEAHFRDELVGYLLPFVVAEYSVFSTDGK